MKRILTLATMLTLALSIGAPVAAQADQAAGRIRAEAETRAIERRQKATDRIAEIRTEAETRRAGIKMDVCEDRQARINNRIRTLSRSATNLKDVIDRMYERVQGFYEDGQLTVSNYEELVQAIELAKDNSETSLEALASYEFEVDCESTAVAQQIDSYRTAVREVRDDLKAYRSSLVDLISALKSENASPNQDTDSEDNSSNETTRSAEEETDE